MCHGGSGCVKSDQISMSEWRKVRQMYGNRGEFSAGKLWTWRRLPIPKTLPRRTESRRTQEATRELRDWQPRWAHHFLPCEWLEPQRGRVPTVPYKWRRTAAEKQTCDNVDSNVYGTVSRQYSFSLLFRLKHLAVIAACHTKISQFRFTFTQVHFLFCPTIIHLVSLSFLCLFNPFPLWNQYFHLCSQEFLHFALDELMYKMFPVWCYKSGSNWCWHSDLTMERKKKSLHRHNTVI